MDAADLHHMKPRFIGNIYGVSSGTIGDFDYWVHEGYFVLKWDGLHIFEPSICFLNLETFPSELIITIDSKDLSGHPEGSNWDATIKDLCEALQGAPESTTDCFDADDLHHYQSNFPNINFDTSLGWASWYIHFIPCLLL